MPLVRASVRSAASAPSTETVTDCPSQSAEMALVDTLHVMRAGVADVLGEEGERIVRACLRLAGVPVRLGGTLDDACALSLATFKQQHGLPFDARVDAETAELLLARAAFAVGAPGTGLLRRMRGSRFDAWVAPFLLVEVPGLALLIRVLRRGAGR